MDSVLHLPVHRKEVEDTACDTVLDNHMRLLLAAEVQSRTLAMMDICSLAVRKKAHHDHPSILLVGGATMVEAATKEEGTTTMAPEEMEVRLDSAGKLDEVVHGHLGSVYRALPLTVMAAATKTLAVVVVGRMCHFQNLLKQQQMILNRIVSLHFCCVRNLSLVLLVVEDANVSVDLTSLSTNHFYFLDLVEKSSQEVMKRPLF